MKRFSAIVLILRARILIFGAASILPIPRPSGPAEPYAYAGSDLLSRSVDGELPVQRLKA
jgi:hypothetical protein